LSISLHPSIPSSASLPCLPHLSFAIFPLDKLYTSSRKQRFDDRNIEDQSNWRALHQTEDEWSDIESLLDELGNTFSNCYFIIFIILLSCHTE